VATINWWLKNSNCGNKTLAAPGKSGKQRQAVLTEVMISVLDIMQSAVTATARARKT